MGNRQKYKKYFCNFIMMNGLQLRNYIYKTLFKFDKLIGRKADFVIICYHSINNDSSWRHSISTQNFEQQIRYLKDNYEIINPENFDHELNTHSGKPKVLITFDDGYKDNLNAMHILNAHNAKALLFILSGNSNEVSRSEMQNDLDILNDNEIIDLLNNGWVLGSHGKTHKNLTLLTDEELKSEITDSKETIQNKYSVSVKYFSYPKGNYTQQIADDINSAGYDYAFSMDDSRKFNYAFALPRVGIDSSHDIELFKATISPSVIQFRSLIKNILPKKFIGLNGAG
ncbi:MAG: hypothetical protein E6Q58_04350 [Niabella sp.]|nr:MAG: hypothetical protein E6Q58_04350 [Niabella sp.]